MINQQLVTVSFFEFTGAQKRWWGFRHMGLAPAILGAVEGLSFYKMLGSGSGNGFSIWPNFGVYGMLCVWEEESFARDFFEKHSLYQEYIKQSRKHWTVFLKTAKVHGQWDGVVPFKENTTYQKDGLIAVLTRATIHTHKLWQFWRFVPPVSRSMSAHQEGLLFSVGIGELPIIQQATFSLWQNADAMMNYAYRSKHHAQVVKRTREVGWYKEELFARFHPYDSIGNWSEPITAALQKQNNK